MANVLEARCCSLLANAFEICRKQHHEPFRLIPFFQYCSWKQDKPRSLSHEGYCAAGESKWVWAPWANEFQARSKHIWAMQASLLKPPHFHTTFSALLSVFLLLLLGKSPGLFVGSGRGLFQAVWKQELEDSRQHLWFQLHHHICQLWPFAGAQQGNQSSMHIHLHHCLHTPSPLFRSLFTSFRFTRCVGQLGISHVLQLLHLAATSKRSIPGSLATDEAVDGEVGRRQLEESVSFLILQGHRSQKGISRHALIRWWLFGASPCMSSTNRADGICKGFPLLKRTL